jgi:uncharacterized protein (DUF1501 family)
MKRRQFLQSSALSTALFGVTGVLPASLSTVFAAPLSKKAKQPILICIFQRGAVDGLSMLVPYQDASYYSARRSIAIAKPGQAGGALTLDGEFALHPAMSSLLPFWKEQRMSAVVAVGSPNNTRSHFDAQDYMESGTPGIKSTRDGWMNRVLQAQQSSKTPFAGVAMTSQTPRSMMGRANIVTMTNLSQFSVNAGRMSGEMQGGFEGLWQEKNQQAFGDAGNETFSAIEFLKKSGAARIQTENGAQYPNSALGRSLRQIAQLIKADVGLQLGFAETGGWDTHVNQGAATGQLANNLRDFSSSIAAFMTDLGPQRDNVILLTMSEFGRTVRENGSRGTDHGHGNVMFALGSKINGRKILGDWKGLDNSVLFEERDVPVTTDFRDVLSELAQQHLGTKDRRALFPGFESKTTKSWKLLA